MGTGAEWLPWVAAALTATGTGVSIYNQNQTAKKQDQTLANQIRMQQGLQQKANARTAQLINNQAQQTDQPQKQASQQLFTQQLAANNPQALNPLKSVGAAGQAYQASGANAAQGITGYGKSQADTLSSIIAPTQQRRDNQKNLDDYSTDIGNLRTQLQGNDFLSQLKLNAIKPNPWLGALSGIATGVGGSMAGNANYGALLAAMRQGGPSPYATTDPVSVDPNDPYYRSLFNVPNVSG
jgi:hypothetical protein